MGLVSSLESDTNLTIDCISMIWHDFRHESPTWCALCPQPRSESVIQAQIKMVTRYGRAHEVMGSGLELRLRIFPTPVTSNLAAA